MGKEFFHYPETAKLFDLLEEVTHRSGVSRGQAFEDFLVMSLCSLSGGQMEELYLQTVQKHTGGKKGKRGCDSIARLFAELVAAMEQDSREQMKDLLGDLFEGGVSYGERGQYMTPMPICELMARLTLHDALPGDNGETTPEEKTDLPEAPASETPMAALRPRRTVYDPCSGSGRMLLAAASINRHWEFVGQDVDLRCVRMTALNLAFRNLYGYVIWGNTLALEKKLVYHTGFNLQGFIREVPLEACPVPVQRAITEPPVEDAQRPLAAESDENPPTPKTQLRLF